MNKITCLIACFSFAVFAQSETENTSPETENASPETENASPETENASPETENAFPETENAFPETENTFLDRTDIGIKLGVNFPSMVYSNEWTDDYESSAYANGLVELFGEFNIIHALSIRPGFRYTTRGQHIDEPGFKYRLNVKYIEFALPVAYTFSAVMGMSPYLLAGPVLGYALGGDMRYSVSRPIYDTQTRHKTKINKGNIKANAFGLYFGTGLKYPISIYEKFPILLGFEAGYHLGLTNTYGKKELNGTSNILNAYSYNIDGTRKNRGIELGVTFALPLANFKKPKQPEQPLPVPESVSEPMPEPLPEPMPEPLTEPEQLPEQENQ